MAERRSPREQAHAHIEQRGRLQAARGREHVPPFDLILGRPDDIQRHPLAGRGFADGHPVALHLPDAHLPAEGQELERIADPDSPGPERPGHHRPEPGHGEAPVDG